MNRQLIWKEWRDQRTPLLALWGLTPLSILGIAWYQGGTLIDMKDAPMTLGFMAILACVFTVGLANFSGEWSRGHGGFLARCPAGLNRAFVVKFLFLGIAALATGILAAGTTMGLQIYLRLDLTGQWIEWTPMLGVGLITTTAFIIAIASWGIQPGFALVGGPLVAGLLTWPLWWHALSESSARLFPEYYLATLRTDETAWEPFATALRSPSPWLWIMAIAAAFLSTWVAFTWRKGQRNRLAPLLPMALALVGTTPAWASWGIDRYQETHCDPGTERFTIDSAFVGADGRFAFLNVSSHFGMAKAVAGAPIKVDLTTGEWETVGGMNSSWTSPFRDGRDRWPSDSFGNAETVTMTSANPDANGLHWDALDGIPTDQARPRARVLTEPDLDTLDIPDGVRVRNPIGLGFRLFDRFGPDESLVYDVDRARVFTFSDFRNYRVLVGKGMWLARKHLHDGSFAPWQLYDPEQESFSMAQGLDNDDKLGSFLTDGRVLGSNAEGIFLYDPASGSRASMGYPQVEYSGIPPVGPRNALDYWGPIATQSSILIRQYLDQENSALGLVSLDTLSISWITLPDRRERLVAMSGIDKCILLVENKWLEEHDFDTGQRRTLFPTEERE